MSITVAIVTRNRATHLKECLVSLTNQTIKPKKILIVNNNSTDNTEKIIHSFKYSLPITTVKEKNVGFSYVYNRALKETKTNWIVFIDDDCTAVEDWFEMFTKKIYGNPKVCTILGNSLNYYPHNIFACAFQFSHEWWKSRSINREKIVDYSVLDSRNIAYNCTFLKKYKIFFDESLIHGAEDSDIGRQIQQKKLIALYAQDIRVYHKEPTTINDFFRKKILYFISGEKLSQKWRKDPIILNKTKIYTLISLFRKYSNKLSIGNKILLILLLCSDVVFQKSRLYKLINASVLQKY